MRQLTNEQKIEVYKLARERCLKRPTTYCMCPDINATCYDLFGIDTFSETTMTKPSYYRLFRMFPEFRALKPGHRRLRQAWWPSDNMDIRLEMYDKLISDLKL